MQTHTTNSRIHTLDALRGIAVLGMIVYHFLFDLTYFTALRINLSFWPIALLGALVRLAFIGIVGVSLYLAHTHSNDTNIFLKKTLQRAFVIGLTGAVISITSWLLFPNSFIRFGILHLISSGILLSIPLIYTPKRSLFLGLCIALVGFSFFPIATFIPHLWWLGFIDTGATDLDYFPLIPWFGVILIGIWVGSIWQEKIQPQFTWLETKKSTHFLAQIGRKALLIYVLHQPILIVAILIAEYYNR